jgi:hypothetical protein
MSEQNAKLNAGLTDGCAKMLELIISRNALMDSFIGVEDPEQLATLGRLVLASWCEEKRMIESGVK